MTGRHACGHSNRVLARVSESWILERIEDLAGTDGLLEQALEMARDKCQSDLRPQQEALTLAKRGLLENQAHIDKLVETISCGGVQSDLLAILNEKATILRLERERLRVEHSRLSDELTPLAQNFDAVPFREVLADFVALAQEAEPQELQRLLQVVVRRIEWMPDGSHNLDLYLPQLQASQMRTAQTPTAMPKSRRDSQESHLNHWLERNVWSGCPNHRSSEPLILQVCRTFTSIIPETATIFRLVSPRLTAGSILRLGSEAL